MNVLSLFDGISAGRLALDRAGIPLNTYYRSEIDKYANKVAMHHYPNDIQLGDVTKWREWDIDWTGIDLLIGGSPCQGFSFAGKQAGTKAVFNGDEVLVTNRITYLSLKQLGAEFLSQSHLFWEYVLCLDHVKKHNPNVKFMLENVKMKKELLKMIDDALGVESVVINSALVSAQNRVRHYWCNWDITQPEDKGIFWGDVREHGVSAEKYYYTDAAMQWLGRSSRKRNKHLFVHNDDEKMQMIEASHHKKYSNQRFFGIVDSPEQSVGAMRGRYLVNGKRKDLREGVAGKTEQFIEFRYDGKTNTLTTVRKDNIVVPFTLPNRVPATEFFFRYITPVECERLQTFPDNYTMIISDTQRYKALGNSWTVDVIAHIFKCMPAK